MHGLVLSALRQLFGPEIAPAVGIIGGGMLCFAAGYFLLNWAFVSLVRYARWIWAHLA